MYYSLLAIIIIHNKSKKPIIGYVNKNIKKEIIANNIRDISKKVIFL